MRRHKTMTLKKDEHVGSWCLANRIGLISAFYQNPGLLLPLTEARNAVEARATWTRQSVVPKEIAPSPVYCRITESAPIILTGLPCNTYLVLASDSLSPTSTSSHALLFWFRTTFSTWVLVVAVACLWNVLGDCRRPIFADQVHWVMDGGRAERPL